MQEYQRAFVDFMLEVEVLTFGDFTTKSGRKTPYFVNTGLYRTGTQLRRLGHAYADAIERAFPEGFDVLFGPAYKGVPLAVATATALSNEQRDVPYGFDRKEVKDHGEGGKFVGTAPAAGMRVVLVDDVITSGASLREAAGWMRDIDGVQVSAAVVAVDRQERGRGEKTTLQELRDDLGIHVIPIVTIREVVEYLHGREIGGKVVLDDAHRDAIESYLATHGAA